MQLMGLLAFVFVLDFDHVLGCENFIYSSRVLTVGLVEVPQNTLSEIMAKILVNAHQLPKYSYHYRKSGSLNPKKTAEVLNL